MAVKIKCLLITVITTLLHYSCGKSSVAFNNRLHSGIVLAATCSSEPSSTEVAVQLDNNDPFSFDWTNPKNDSTYQNVIVTFDPVLIHSIGKTINYSSTRKPNGSDTLANLTPAICISYPVTYLNNVNVK